MTLVMENKSKITLYRYGRSQDSIYGTLNIYTEKGDKLSLQTIENAEKCIEQGTYNMYHAYSPKFDTNLWTLHVPNRTGIRIHSANTGNQLRGCIAPGLFKKDNQVYQSKKALSLIHTLLNKYKTYKIEIL